MTRSCWAALLILALAGCSTAPTSSPAAGSAAAGPSGGDTRNVGISRLTGINPTDKAAAGINIAFDERAAGALLTPLQAGIDFTLNGVLCLSIGERATGGWAVTIQSIQIVDGAMQIAARETEPRGIGTGPPSYPADCVLVPRADLPGGDLSAVATDVTSDEFIVDGRLSVPAPASAP